MNINTRFGTYTTPFNGLTKRDVLLCSSLADIDDIKSYGPVERFAHKLALVLEAKFPGNPELDLTDILARHCTVTVVHLGSEGEQSLSQAHVLFRGNPSPCTVSFDFDHGKAFLPALAAPDVRTYKASEANALIGLLMGQLVSDLRSECRHAAQAAAQDGSALVYTFEPLAAVSAVTTKEAA